MTSLLLAIVTGLWMGLIHVLSGPDHLAAVGPLSMERRDRGAWRVGLRWGLGHTSGVLVVGLLALLLREVLPIERLASYAEWLVGVVLIVIGLWGIRKALTFHLHTHEHSHDGESHVHVHVHGRKTAHASSSFKTHLHTHAAFAIGTLHGLAGSSHVLGVLPALAFPNRLQAFSYLAAFGVGTIFAMTSFASVLGWMAQGSVASGHRIYRGLMLGCSSAAVIIGGYWLLG